MSTTRLLAATALLAFSSSCTVESRPVEVATTAAPLSASVRELSELSFESLGITGRDGGYSARFGGVSAWVFGDTFSKKAPTDGSVLSSTWSWTRDRSAADGVIGPFEQSADPRDSTDPSGAATQLIPYDTAGWEIAWNIYHACSNATSGPGCSCAAADAQCGDRFALWPGTVIAYRDNAGQSRALLPYTELYVHPSGSYDYTIRGTSIARWDDPRKPVVRTPSAVFGPDDPQMTAGAIKYMAAGVEYLYLYTCAPIPSTLDAECRLGRAPFLRGSDDTDALGSIQRRADWRFYAGGDPDAASSWSSTATDGVRVLTASTILSLEYNADLGSFVALYMQFGTNDVHLQTAPRPEGPWSGHTTPLFSVGPVQNGKFDYYPLIHSEFDLAADGGARMYVTTSHPDPDDPFRMPLRSFEVTLDR